MTPEEAEARTLFKEVTGGSDQDYADILSLPADKQRGVLETYRDAVYDAPADKVAGLLAALEVVGAVVGAVSGVTGAVGGVLGLASAVRALRK